MRIVIHGGMYKTGTTSLQESLSKNRDILSRHGIEYPDAGNIAHWPLLRVGHPEWNPDTLTKIAEQAESKKATILFLSSEGVCRFNEEQFKILTGCFSKWPVQYVFCFRHWSSYLYSRWTQNSKRRDSQTFKQYLDKSMNLDNKYCGTHYDQILSYAASSGAHKVSAVSYERSIHCEGSVSKDILKASHIDENIIKLILNKIGWLNSKPKAIDVEICRLLNGVTSQLLGLGQDPLFESFIMEKRCSEFFDYYLKINLLSPYQREMIITFLERGGRQRVVLPDFNKFEQRLVINHAHRFVNISDGDIFGHHYSPLGELLCYSAHWSDCLTMIKEKCANLLIV